MCNTVAMKSNVDHFSGVDLTEVSFHPASTFRSKTKKFASGVWYYIVVLGFVLGLPAITCLTIERVQHFFAH